MLRNVMECYGFEDEISFFCLSDKHLSLIYLYSMSVSRLWASVTGRAALAAGSGGQGIILVRRCVGVGPFHSVIHFLVRNPIFGHGGVRLHWFLQNEASLER